jgi:hypothetical protein
VVLDQEVVQVLVEQIDQEVVLDQEVEAGVEVDQEVDQ